jgi:site-specific DNA-adenine methylase
MFLLTFSVLVEFHLENNVVPMTKRMWITSIKREIQNYWQKLITSIASYYPRLKYLNDV